MNELRGKRGESLEKEEVQIGSKYGQNSGWWEWVYNGVTNYVQSGARVLGESGMDSANDNLGQRGFYHPIHCFCSYVCCL
jgi:hypothetical protein